MAIGDATKTVDVRRFSDHPLDCPLRRCGIGATHTLSPSNVYNRTRCIYRVVLTAGIGTEVAYHPDSLKIQGLIDWEIAGYRPANFALLSGRQAVWFQSKERANNIELVHPLERQGYAADVMLPKAIGCVNRFQGRK